MKKVLSISVLVMGFASVGCSDNVETGCESNSECRYGRVCANSVCSDPESEADPGTHTPEPDEPATSRGETVDAGPFAEFIHGQDTEPLVGYTSCECTHNGGFRIILFLQHDGRARAYYEEGILGHGFNATSEASFGDVVDTRVRVDDRWSVDGEVLKVGDWLTCTYKPAAEFSSASGDCALNRDFQDAKAETFMRFSPGHELDGLPTDPDAPEYDVYSPVE